MYKKNQPFQALFKSSDPFGQDPLDQQEHATHLNLNEQEQQHVQSQNFDSSTKLDDHIQIVISNSLMIKQQQQKKKALHQANLLQKKMNQKKFKQEQLKKQIKLHKKKSLVEVTKLQQFNAELTALYSQLMDKYTDKINNIIDEKNWKCLEQNKRFFEMSTNKEQFKQKYKQIDFIETTDHDYCGCCRNSKQTYIQCQNFDLQKFLSCFKCCLCHSWGVLMMSTFGCVGIPYFLYECAENQLDCYCFDCIKCCSCLFKYLGDTQNDKINRSQTFCYSPYIFGKTFKIGYDLCLQCKQYFPTCCKCCLQNTGLFPVGCCINFCTCLKTCFHDYVTICRQQLCGKRQVLQRLSQIYSKYQRQVIEGEQIGNSN